MNVHCLDKNGDTIYTLYQWDKNQTIYVDGIDVNTAPYIHFQNRNTKSPTVVESTITDGMISVLIPNELLDMPFTIEGYIYVQESNMAKSIGMIQLPVRERQQPSDTEYVETLNLISLQELNKEIDRLTVEVNVLSEQMVANNLPYNNATSGLSANSVQEALDELSNYNYLFFE